MKIYVIVYQDVYKPKVMGAFDNKNKAIQNLLIFLSNHNPIECNCNLCKNCEEYYILLKDLIKTGTAAGEYSIHEIEYNKNF